MKAHVGTWFDERASDLWLSDCGTEADTSAEDHLPYILRRYDHTAEQLQAGRPSGSVQAAEAAPQQTGVEDGR